MIHIIRRTQQCITHFVRPLKEGQYEVLPPPELPSHIVKPQYATSSNPKVLQYDTKEMQFPVQQRTSIEMKKAASIAMNTLHQTHEWLKTKPPNITAETIDRFVFDRIVQQGAYPTPIGFMGFPKSVCISINECIVHGIPSNRPIYEGDKINIDVTAYYDGHHGDTNLTLVYGGQEAAPTPQINSIINITQKALYEAISICKPGVKVNEIGKTIQRFAKSNGVHVCEDFTGHGIGELLHMPPMVFHTYFPQFRDTMKVGNIFTIQPILTHYPIQQLSLWNDGMTVIAENNPNAQFEHMVMIVEGGCEVLTQRPGEQIPNPTSNIQNLKL